MEFIDLKAQYRALKTEMDRAIQAAVTEGQFIMGRQVGELEAEIAAYLGVKNVIACANGTDALQMLYMAYGVGEGDAVFCPDVTFIASVEPAVMLGAKPVFCDIDPQTFNISPESLLRQIESVRSEGRYRPKAIVAVDFLGNPADYPALAEIAEKYGLLLINDAAQSFGAELNGHKCGAFGYSAATSFFPAKPLGCYGDGGAVMTNDGEIAELCRSIRVHGKGASKYENVRIGMNSRLDTLQAAVLSVKLKALKAYEMEERQRVAGRYNAAFAGRLQTQRIPDGGASAWAQYAVLAEDTRSRDSIMARLQKKNIPTMIYYPYPQHTLAVFEGVEQYGEAFAAANDYCARTLSLPMSPYLTEEDQEAVISAVLASL